MIPAAAVLASAIEDAEGFPVSSMPMSPSDLFELRRSPYPGDHAVKITGRRDDARSQPRGLDALNDPAVLVRTIPGCERLEATGPDPTR